MQQQAPQFDYNKVPNALHALVNWNLVENNLAYSVAENVSGCSSNFSNPTISDLVIAQLKNIGIVLIYDSVIVIGSGTPKALD